MERQDPHLRQCQGLAPSRHGTSCRFPTRHTRSVHETCILPWMTMTDPKETISTDQPFTLLCTARSTGTPTPAGPNTGVTTGRPLRFESSERALSAHQGVVATSAKVRFRISSSWRRRSGAMDALDLDMLSCLGNLNHGRYSWSGLLRKIDTYLEAHDCFKAMPVR